MSIHIKSKPFINVYYELVFKKNIIQFEFRIYKSLKHSNNMLQKRERISKRKKKH